jgi:hypothetical protein
MGRKKYYFYFSLFFLSIKLYWLFHAIVVSTRVSLIFEHNNTYTVLLFRTRGVEVLLFLSLAFVCLLRMFPQQANGLRRRRTKKKKKKKKIGTFCSIVSQFIYCIDSDTCTTLASCDNFTIFSIFLVLSIIIIIILSAVIATLHSRTLKLEYL